MENTNVNVYSPLSVSTSQVPFLLISSYFQLKNNINQRDLEYKLFELKDFETERTSKQDIIFLIIPNYSLTGYVSSIYYYPQRPAEGEN
jgi:hypothetical protein